MFSKFVKPKSLAHSMLSMVAIAPLVLASSPGYTQTSSPAESPATLIPVTPPLTPPDFSALRPGVCPPSRLIASIVSSPRPLPGQTSRSSRNFNLNSIRVGEIFNVIVVQGGRVNNGIRFNLKRDIALGRDPIVGPNMRTGTYQRTSNYPLNPVYIADPRGATTNFVVQFCRR